MNQILSTFGIDWRLLIINAINFALVLVVLWYFLWEPLMRTLEARREKVAQSVRDAEEAQHKLHAIEESRAAILARAGRESDDLLARARAAGEAKRRELLAAGEAAAARQLEEAAAQARELKVAALVESREAVAKLVVLGVEKMLQKNQ